MNQKVMHPDPNWLACALQGGILPPVSSYWELKKDERIRLVLLDTPEAELLHNMKPIDAMTEEQAYRISHNERYTRTRLERLRDCKQTTISHL